MIQKKKLTKNLLIIFIAFTLAGFLTYSLIEYQKSGIAQQGIVTCANEQCFWSAHIHLYVPMQICGEKHVLPKFKGSLADNHTHGDESIIHWHDKVAYDAEKKQFSEPTPFALNLVLQTFELPITDGMCNGLAAEWKVFVNGKARNDWKSYEWKDRDIILFVFDERTAEEIEEELNQNPIKFPFVGEG